MKFKVVDLFSGCGGFSFGFQEAGYEIVLGIDNDNKALETFKNNHNNSITENLSLAESDNIRKIAKIIDRNNGVDVIIAGPPCQGFSLTGSRNENDKRNKLFYSVFELAQQTKQKPKAVIIENVPGLAKLYGSKAKNEIFRKFEECGYNCTLQELFAPDYGVPQIRKRIFFVGVLKKYGKFEFPKPILKPDNYITCEDAIGDLPSLEKDLGQEVSKYEKNPYRDYQKKMRGNNSTLHNHVGTKHTDLVKSVISHVPEGGNHKNLPKGIGESRKFNEAWTRYHSQKPSKTIDTGHRNHFHYKYNRIPTVRENARLQSFPDDFIFVGNRTQQNRQVGNAVPPLLGFHIAKQLRNVLEKKK